MKDTAGITKLPLLDLFRPGMRVAVAVSGGADSVALLRALVSERERLGLVLSVVHVNHGIRGGEADADCSFVEALAAAHSLPFHLERVDAPVAASTNRETLEEAARNLRYAFFNRLMASGHAEAVATAHTLDDQAETVLHRLLRGAWTEGLGGIHPVLAAPKNGGPILRPFLSTRRAEIEAWLLATGQPWREDSTNLDQAHTRNRIRHSLLPELAKFNPRIATRLAHTATLARDEEDYWSRELARVLPSLLLPGKPVRGGGRSSAPGVPSTAVEVERLRALHPALRRRVLRAAASQLGVALDFFETEQLMRLCEPGASTQAGKRTGIGAQLSAQRSARELRLLKQKLPAPGEDSTTTEASLYTLPIPGEVTAPNFGIHVRVELGRPPPCGNGLAAPRVPDAILRAPRPGDKVRLRHSSGPRKLKDIFERLNIAAADRPSWPLIEWNGEIVWMQGIEIQSGAADAADLRVEALRLDSSGTGLSPRIEADPHRSQIPKP